MNKTIFLSLVAMLLFSSCKKEINSLPDETQTGANTFGAKINGENWGPLGAGVLPTAPTLEASFAGNNSVIIHARNFSRTPLETEMEIYLAGIGGPGTFQLNQSTNVFPDPSASYAYYVKRNINVVDEWMTNMVATGQVVVTKYDLTQHILSGNFQFTANARYGSAPITVTEGRFDVNVQ